MDDFGKFDTAWCPGCGNHSILATLKKTLAGMGLAPRDVLLVSGIGQAAKLPHYLKANVFNGLHGRSLPPAQGAKMANPGLKVIVHSGDGCSYGEGGNHFLAAIRRNTDITLLAHDNQIYGLTKGQASPTTNKGQVTKAQPFGQISEGFNPVAVAVAMRASFVARAFSGDQEHLSEMIRQAVEHKGFSLVDILQPCVSFNKVNTFAWYKERCYRLEGHDPGDFGQAMDKAMEFGDKIPLGIIFKLDRVCYEQENPNVGEPLVNHRPDMEKLRKIMNSYM